MFTFVFIRSFIHGGLRVFFQLMLSRIFTNRLFLFFFMKFSFEIAKKDSNVKSHEHEKGNKGDN